MRTYKKLRIISTCRTNQKRDIREQDKEKEGQALSLISRVLLVVRIAKALCFRTKSARNADFIKAERFYENSFRSPAQKAAKNSPKSV